MEGDAFAQKDKKETKGQLERGRKVNSENHENRFADMESGRRADVQSGRGRPARVASAEPFNPSTFQPFNPPLTRRGADIR